MSFNASTMLVNIFVSTQNKTKIKPASQQKFALKKKNAVSNPPSLQRSRFKILNLRAEQTHNHTDDFNEENHQLNNDIGNR